MNNTLPIFDCDGTDLSQFSIESWREYMRRQDWKVPRIGSAVSKVIAAAYRAHVSLKQAVEEIHQHLVSIRAERSLHWLRSWALEAWMRVYTKENHSLKGGLLHG